MSAKRATGMKALTRLRPVGSCGLRHARRPMPVPARGAIAKTHPAARQTDLPQHRGQRHRRPVRLFTVIGALERPADGDHGAYRGHASGEVLDALRRNLRNGRGPGGIFGLAIAVAQEVGPKTPKPTQ